MSFEAVRLDDSVDIPRPPPSSDLPLPAPTAPIHLPALKTVDKIPSECLSARVGRQWRTPAVKTLITQSLHAASGVVGAKVWLGDCQTIEVLDLTEGHLRWLSTGRVAADVLSVLPADGRSLAALRTLRGVWIGRSSPAEIDMLREVLVARGVRQSIRELEIDLATILSNSDGHWEKVQRAAVLVEAVAHRDALRERVVGDCDGDRDIYAELLSRSSTGTPTVQKLINESATTAGTVMYSGRDEAIPAAFSDDTFGIASILQLLDDALDDEAKKKRAVEIAAHMPSLSHFKAGDYDEVLDAPAGDVWVFLERLQTALVSKGRERSLSVEMFLPANAFLEPVHARDSPCLWGPASNEKLPPIEEVEIHVSGDVAGHHLKKFYRHVMAAVASFSKELKGHKKTQVHFSDDADGLSTDFERRFLAEQIGLNFSGSPYKFSLDGDGLCVERRT